jgi:class I fructose-bisphosphate aldolase
MANRAVGLLGPEAESLPGNECRAIWKETLHLPGPTFIGEVFALSNRPSRILRDLRFMFDCGGIGGSGYLSILPADEGINYSAGVSFAQNPRHFERGRVVELTIETRTVGAEGDNPPRFEGIVKAD